MLISLSHLVQRLHEPSIVKNKKLLFGYLIWMGLPFPWNIKCRKEVIPGMGKTICVFDGFNFQSKLRHEIMPSTMEDNRNCNFDGFNYQRKLRPRIMPSTMGWLSVPNASNINFPSSSPKVGCIFHNYSSWRVKIGFLGEFMSVEKMLGTIRRCLIVSLLRWLKCKHRVL